MLLRRQILPSAIFFFSPLRGASAIAPLSVERRLFADMPRDAFFRSTRAIRQAALPRRAHKMHSIRALHVGNRVTMIA